VKIVTRDLVLRKIITQCNKIIEDAYQSTDADETLRLAERLIFDITNESATNTLVHISQPAAALIDRMDALAKDKNAFSGLQTGFPIFDKLTNGLQKGDLDILAARPSVGKTAFALNIIANIAKRKGEKRVIALYSLEMPSTQIAQRMLSNMSSVDMSELKTGELIGDSHRNLWEMTKILSDSRIFVNDSGVVSPNDILNQCRKLCCSGKGFKSIDLVVVDYLGLMTSDVVSKDANRQYEIARMSKAMKTAAKELNCPVILLSQMSRSIESRDDKTPMLSDLRESGAIEQDADIVMFLSRENEDDHDGPILLNIAKHRNGELKQIRFDWAGRYQRFTESREQPKYEIRPQKISKQHKSGDSATDEA
jgi:replicative DNA helicase